MAEVTLVGGEVMLLPTADAAPSGLAEVMVGGLIPVTSAGIGGLLSPLACNLTPAAAGSPVVMPGVRQGILAPLNGGMVDFTDWVWKTRYPPWCGFTPPVVRRLSVWLTPQSNDPTGRQVQLSIDWGDGTTTEGCQSGHTYAHTYAGMGRYTLAVRAENALGDGLSVQRDVVMVAYPDREDAWRWGQSPGSLPSEEER